MAERRSWRTGSVYLHKGAFWTAVIPLPPTSDGRRRRKYVRCRSRDEAEALVTAMRVAPRHVSVRTPISKPVRITAQEAVRRTLERAADLKWDMDFTVAAVVASVRPTRLSFGVTGPCVYCGDELADTVDHVDPEGGDGPENVASACMRCNILKGKRTPEQWLGKGLQLVRPA